ncbi:hypothetical protein ACG2LH_00975 [Zhouia sp. PK063]|uniref:hypothetical protein n=1 Tax=Zhouia sp. PK063 TaxID=3373602 RepID=UPI0037937493
MKRSITINVQGATPGTQKLGKGDHKEIIEEFKSLLDQIIHSHVKPSKKLTVEADYFPEVQKFQIHPLPQNSQFRLESGISAEGNHIQQYLMLA